MTEVVVRSQVGLAQTVELGQHRMTVDEPREAGGSDLGPSPYELLLAALGACTSMTLTLYAQRKGWSLTGVQVRLRHDRIHARDCAECETETGYLDRIQKDILVRGSLDDEQLQRLAEIAKRCPVNQTLGRDVRIEDSITLG
jgi:putative redox protein